MKKNVLRLFAFFLVLFTSAQVLAQTELPPDLDAYVARTIKEFEVPGLAIAVVKDGKVALAKGYGVRRLGEAAPVDEQTLFGIASNTKAFTAAALAILVDEGKISWDDPVTKRLPGFQAKWVIAQLDFVTFALKPDGGIEQMKMVPVSPHQVV
jgi:CubicO group peptidase (beta-lactamase class C family)